MINFKKTFQASLTIQVAFLQAAAFTSKLATTRCFPAFHSPRSSLFSYDDDTTMVTSKNEGMKEQWKLWPYFEESIKWHSEWIRYDAESTSINERFQACCDFTAHGDHNTQRHTYMYGDGRGTLSEGPTCGPWKQDKAEGSYDSLGMIHPARPYMRTLLSPDRTGAWLMKELPPHGESPSGFELFLGDGESLRISVGIIYDATGALKQVSAIREDSREEDERIFWSKEEEPLLKHTNSDDKLIAMKKFWPKIDSEFKSVTSMTVTVPGPVQEIAEGLDQVDLTSLKFNSNNLQDEDVVYEMPDGIFLVCPSQIPDSSSSTGDFWIAAGWKKDESLTSTIEARYSNFIMSHIVHTKFTF